MSTDLVGFPKPSPGPRAFDTEPCFLPWCRVANLPMRSHIYAAAAQANFNRAKRRYAPPGLLTIVYAAVWQPSTIWAVTTRTIAKLFDSRRPLGYGRTPRLELWIPAFAGKTGWGHIPLYGRTLQSSYSHHRVPWLGAASRPPRAGTGGKNRWSVHGHALPTFLPRSGNRGPRDAGVWTRCSGQREGRATARRGSGRTGPGRR